MMVNSIKKGKSFEREIAKLLSEKTGAKWVRVPMSGGFASLNDSKDPRFQGDVFTEDSFPPLVVECKSYAEFNLNDLFSTNSKFYSWVNQSIAESKGLDWVLFIKAKNKGVYAACIDGTGLAKLGFIPDILVKLSSLKNLIITKIK